MLKSLATSAVALGTALGCCQAPAQQPAPATPCVVWAGADEVIGPDDPRQAQLDGTCELNLIFPTHAEAKAECGDHGGRLGQLLDTCYDVDY